MTEHVRVTRHEAVRVLSLDRPEAKNALSLAMYDALTEALVDAGADDGVRAVLLRGEGGVFCAGNDVRDFLDHPPTGDDSPVLRFLAAVAAFPKPLIAAVDGPAVGLGTTVLLHCDGAIASERAMFVMPFAQLGLVPEAGSTLLVPALVGHRRAMELLALGRPFSAEEAERWGFVNSVVPAEGLDAAALALALRYAALPPGAVRATKALLRQPHPSVEAAIAAEARVFLDRLASDEAREALAAVLTRKR